MNKTIARIACTGLFLIAALTLGRKMFIEDRITSNSQVHTRSADSVIAGGQDRNASDTGNSIKFTGTDNGIGSLSTDSILLTSEGSVYENEDQPGGSGYGNAAHNARDSKKITDRYGYNGSHSTHASPGNGAVSRQAGSTPGNTGRLYAGGSGGGGGGTTIPGLSAGANPDREKARADEDKSDPGHGSKPSGVDYDGDKTASGNPSDKGVPPEYFDAPPGNGLDDFLQPQVSPGKENGNRGDYEETGKGAGASENPGISTIPEPASNLLIGLGGMMLLWLRRRGSRN